MDNDNVQAFRERSYDGSSRFHFEDGYTVRPDARVGKDFQNPDAM